MYENDDAMEIDSENMELPTQGKTPSKMSDLALSSDSSSRGVDTPNESSDVADLLRSEIPLTAIEQNAPRDYIRIAVVFPYNRQDSIAGLQVFNIKRSISQTFAKTLLHWPFLAGRFETSSEDPTKLRLFYTPGAEHHSEQLQCREPDLKEDRKVHHLSIEDCDRSRFASENEPEPGDEFSPVTVKVTFCNGLLILGFAFSAILFDGEFIHNFLEKFSTSSHSPKFYPPQGSSIAKARDVCI